MQPVALFCMATRLAVHLRRRGRIVEVWERRKAGELTRHLWAVWLSGEEAAALEKVALGVIAGAKPTPCNVCHTIGKVAFGQVGPDLTNIATRADAAYIRESIMDPQAVIVPRPPAEFAGDVRQVFDGTSPVREDTGRDVTNQFIDGAQRTVEYALEQGCVAAVLTDGSPSCGSTYVYDGSFSGATHTGMGVVAQLLTDNGIKVFPETQLEAADAYLRNKTR